MYGTGLPRSRNGAGHCPPYGAISSICLGKNAGCCAGNSFFHDFFNQHLTSGRIYAIIIKLNPKGEVSERFKEPVLKTGDAAMHRGFESHPLRHTISGFAFTVFGEIPKW